MLATKLFLVLIFLGFLSGCSFEENRKIENLLTSSVDNFHALFNQEKFEQIYSETDDELKNKFTEQQFVSYLEVIKNDVGQITVEPYIWINDGFKDGIKRILFEKIEFSNSQIILTDKAKYTKKFYWIVKNGEAKIVSYEVNKLCDKPCTIGIGRK